MTSDSPTPSAQTIIDELMESHKATTQGEWYFEPEYEYITANDEQSMIAEIRGFGSGEPTQANGRFIVAAHTLLPALAEEMKKLEAEARQYKEAYEVEISITREMSGREAFLHEEIDRLRTGNFTAEEFQSICHNLPEDCTAEAFCKGCEDYQTNLFGRSPIALLRQQKEAAEAKAKGLAKAVFNESTVAATTEWQKPLNRAGAVILRILFQSGYIQRHPTENWYRWLPQEAETKEVKG
jgi:hypothetical protein